MIFVKIAVQVTTIFSCLAVLHYCRWLWTLMLQSIAATDLETLIPFSIIGCVSFHTLQQAWVKIWLWSSFWLFDLVVDMTGPTVK